MISLGLRKETYLSCHSEGPVNVEEADCVFEGAGLEWRVDASCFGHGCKL